MEDWRQNDWMNELRRTAARKQIFVKAGSILRVPSALKTLLGAVEDTYVHEFGSLNENDYKDILESLKSDAILPLLCEPGHPPLSAKGTAIQYIHNTHASVVAGGHSTETGDGHGNGNGDGGNNTADSGDEQGDGNGDGEGENSSQNSESQNGESGNADQQGNDQAVTSDNSQGGEESEGGEQSGDASGNSQGGEESEGDAEQGDETSFDGLPTEAMEEIAEQITVPQPKPDPKADDFAGTVNGWVCNKELLKGYFKPYFWDKLMNLLTTKLTKADWKFFNAMLWGDAGLGKTEVAHATAKYIFGQEMAVAIISPDTVSKITGHYNMKDEYVPSELITAMAEECILLIDEAALTPTIVQPHMNSFLNNGFIKVRKHEKMPDGSIRYWMDTYYRHPHCIVFLCDNTNGDGGRAGFERYPIDKSVKDRMALIREVKWDGRVARKIGGVWKATFCESFNEACDKADMTERKVSYRAIKDMLFEELANEPTREVILDCVVKDIPDEDLLTIFSYMVAPPFNDYFACLKQIVEEKGGVQQ